LTPRDQGRIEQVQDRGQRRRGRRRARDGGQDGESGVGDRGGGRRTGRRREEREEGKRGVGGDLQGLGDCVARDNGEIDSGQWRGLAKQMFRVSP
jgi:hypothetical protein